MIIFDKIIEAGYRIAGWGEKLVDHHPIIGRIIYAPVALPFMLIYFMLGTLVAIITLVLMMWARYPIKEGFKEIIEDNKTKRD